MTVRLREAGDAALVVELGASARLSSSAIQAVNARVCAIARALAARALTGVRDIVPTVRSVAVMFDPLLTDVAALAAEIRECAAHAPAFSSGTLHRVQVEYGGEAGPDLDEVAAYARCSPEAVVHRHASRAYRVLMLGFLPGFAYLGPVDDAIAVPRRKTPRLTVPAGSVGIAGLQTGIYPIDSPGGWQVIGRAAVRPFDPSRVPPTFFAPGDDVRFEPVAAGAIAASDSESRQPDGGGGSMYERSITVLLPGLLTTVQDLGRWGYQAAGVSPAGPMDRLAHRLSNALVGNRGDAAALEVTWLGPELRVEQDTHVAVAGADVRATVDGVELPLDTAVRCREGSLLRLGERRSGARAYVAFGGGVAVPPVLGSRACHMRSRLGPLGGRPLRAGDRLPLGPVTRIASTTQIAQRPLPMGGARLRILPGPQVEHFTSSALESLTRTRFTISPDSDRMGYRLVGGRPELSAGVGDMLSEPTFAGALQVPTSGHPILLMVDRPTTGGYPQVAIVITADLPVAAQLAPGDWVEFEPCTRAEAIAALVVQEGQLLAVS